MTGRPYPKEAQLARSSERRRFRIRATRKQWQRIIAEKQGPCRICTDPANNGRLHGLIEFHHLVPRDFGGDDLPDNIIPLCPDCHKRITELEQDTCCLLVWKLTDAEYSYAVGKLGEGVFERVYRVRFSRG